MTIAFSAALLIARVILGGTLAAHGAQKLFGWFGGHGPSGTGGFFEQLGFRPGVLFAIAAGLGEFAGGVLTLLGFLGPVGPVLIILVMLVAILSVHVTKGLFSQNGGFELPLTNAGLALVIAFAGSGIYSLDALFGWSIFEDPKQVCIAVGVAIVLALLNLLVRRPSRAT